MKRIIIALLLLLLPRPDVSTAQELEIDDLSDTFDAVFSHILGEQFSLSPGDHAQHYHPAAEMATDQLVPSLNSLIASNIASFPLSSTVAGITFDFRGGQPVRVVESLGPIFAETAATLGSARSRWDSTRRT